MASNNKKKWIDGKKIMYLSLENVNNTCIFFNEIKKSCKIHFTVVKGYSLTILHTTDSFPPLKPL